MKHESFMKTKQQDKFSVSLLTKIRLKENEGMHKTSLRTILLVSWMLPRCVANMKVILGKLTLQDIFVMLEVKKEELNTIWSVVPDSMIKETLFCFKNHQKCHYKAWFYQTSLEVWHWFWNYWSLIYWGDCSQYTLGLNNVHEITILLFGENHLLLTYLLT